MFKLKFTISAIIFISFLIITSFIKNQSRILEKKIHNLSFQVVSKEKNLSETQLDFYYLTSPSENEKRITKKKYKEFKPIAQSKIFLNINDLIQIEKKLTNLNGINEKNKQKE